MFFSESGIPAFSNSAVISAFKRLRATVFQVPLGESNLSSFNDCAIAFLSVLLGWSRTEKGLVCMIFVSVAAVVESGAGVVAGGDSRFYSGLLRVIGIQNLIVLDTREWGFSFDSFTSSDFPLCICPKIIN